MYLWATDTHFDKLNRSTVKDWGREVRTEYSYASGLILTGDISVSNKLENHLKELVQSLGFPIYFVTGNHDAYYSSFAELDKMIGTWEDCGLFSLEGKYFELAPGVALVGTSGFYDGIFGNIKESSVEMNDWYKIEELKNPEGRMEYLAARTAKQAFQLMETMDKAGRKGYLRQVVATHFPPFPKLIQGREPEEIPYYGSGNIGNAILAGAAPLDEVIVLCGHTHVAASIQEERNIFAYCGASKYGVPEINGILDTELFEVHMF